MYLKVLIVLAVYSRLVFGKQPNIVFILADDYGWNDIGYHDSDIKTPTLDKLAADVCCRRNKTREPLCSARVHTNPQCVTVWKNARMHIKLKSEEPVCHPLQDTFLPEKLRQLGYATHIVGKWHLGFYTKRCTPIHRGFDTFFGFFSGQETYFTHERNGFLDFHSQTSRILKAEKNYKGVYSTHIFAQKAQNIIKNHKRVTPNKPLFLYLPFQAVHLPNQVPSHYEQQYKHFLNTDRRTYAAMVTCMDEGVRNITHSLIEHGMFDNTIIVFSSDNGGVVKKGASNWPLRGFKETWFEGGIRVNAFVYSLLLNNTRTTHRDLFHITDWFPTFVHAAGGRTDGMDIDGIDQWDTLRNGKPSKRQELLHDIDITLSPHGKSSVSDIFDTRITAAIRVYNWKLLTGHAGGSQWHIRPLANATETLHREINVPKDKNVWLFDIANDPHEEHDLSSTNKAIVTSLLRKLRHYQQQTLNIKWPEKDPSSNPKLHGGVWRPWVSNAGKILPLKYTFFDKYFYNVSKKQRVSKATELQPDEKRPSADVGEKPLNITVFRRNDAIAHPQDKANQLINAYKYVIVFISIFLTTVAFLPAMKRLLRLLKKLRV